MYILANYFNKRLHLQRIIWAILDSVQVHTKDKFCKHCELVFEFVIEFLFVRTCQTNNPAWKLQVLVFLRAMPTFLLRIRSGQIEILGFSMGSSYYNRDILRSLKLCGESRT